MYVNEWVVKIDDLTSTVSRIRELIKSGDEKNAKRLLPAERVYQVEPRIGKRLLI